MGAVRASHPYNQERAGARRQSGARVIVPAAGAAGQLEVCWNELSPLVVHLLKIALPEAAQPSAPPAALRTCAVRTTVQYSASRFARLMA